MLGWFFKLVSNRETSSTEGHFQAGIPFEARCLATCGYPPCRDKRYIVLFSRRDWFGGDLPYEIGSQYELLRVSEALDRLRANNLVCNPWPSPPLFAPFGVSRNTGFTGNWISNESRFFPVMHSTDISRFQVARELLGTFWYLTSLSQIPHSKKEVAE